MSNNKRVNDEIKENVCDFFRENAKECIDILLKADDPQISKIYQKVNEQAIRNYFADANILLLTANKYEANILHQSIYEKQNKQDKRIAKIELHFSNSIYYFYFFDWGRYKVAHAVANSTGSNTIGGAEDMIRISFRYKEFQPLAVISFGICFGINHKKQRLGDVIISDKVYSYGEGLKIKGQKLEIIDDNNFIVVDSLRQSLKRLRDENVLSNVERVFIGNYITGEAVMSNEAFKQKIVKSVTTNEVLGGEMEGYGMFKECMQYGRTGNGQVKLPCVIIKAICDWGAQKNDFLNTLNPEHSGRKIPQDEHIDIISNFSDIEHYYITLGKKFDKRVGIDEVEEIIKNSIQAYAAKRSFVICDRIFGSENCVFGRTTYDRICSYVKDYNSDSHSQNIHRSTLMEYAESILNIQHEETEELIQMLIKNKVLIRKKKDDLYYINYQ